MKNILYDLFVNILWLEKSYSVKKNIKFVKFTYFPAHSGNTVSMNSYLLRYILWDLSESNWSLEKNSLDLI